MYQVKDPTLRDSLLKKVAGSQVDSKMEAQSAIFKEIEMMGSNPEKVRETVKIGRGIILFMPMSSRLVFFCHQMVIFCP